MAVKKIQLLMLLIFSLTVPKFAICEVKEELHRTYPFAKDGRVSLENLNGDVFINVWDKKEIQIDAIKWAKTSTGLARAQIVIDAEENSVDIETKYSHEDDWDENDGASVEYHLIVPRHSVLDVIRLVNGSLEIRDVKGEVSASCVNGKLTAEGLAKSSKISAVNGSVMLSFETLNQVHNVEVSSVNGKIEVAIPTNASADFRANTIFGQINNDFDFLTEKTGFVGRHLQGTLGSGATSIKLSNVNGSITIRRL